MGTKVFVKSITLCVNCYFVLNSPLKCFCFRETQHKLWADNWSELSRVYLQCLKQYVRLNIEEGNIAQLTCPDAACKITGHLSRRDIELLATPTLLRRYVRLSFERGECHRHIITFGIGDDAPAILHFLFIVNNLGRKGSCVLLTEISPSLEICRLDQCKEQTSFHSCLLLMSCLPGFGCGVRGFTLSLSAMSARPLREWLSGFPISWLCLLPKRAGKRSKNRILAWILRYF